MSCKLLSINEQESNQGAILKLEFRKYLSLPGMLKKVSSTFHKIIDPLKTNRPRVILRDCLMSGLAMFLLKYPSLLSFDEAQDCISDNLKNLYGLEKIPSDTYLRERLDVINPTAIRPVFKSIFSMLQRGKALEDYYFDVSPQGRHINATHNLGGYLLSIDGTGLFSSHEIHCDQCNVKNHKDGSKTYYHQMLSAVLVHPNKKEVIPLAPEPILKTDGDTKNDCERNAAKRLLTDTKREHPHMKFIVVEDGLSSNAPHISLLQELNMRFILGAKPTDHTFLFDWVNNSKCTWYEITDKHGTKHRYRFINQVPLNEANFDLNINFLEYWEEKKNGDKQHFSWVTDITITEKNCHAIMIGGRARWKIENETFNTLKNQGYHFEHNFGHGDQYLCTVFANLMMLAFLIDQTQQLCCAFFQAALKFQKRKVRLWERMRECFRVYIFKRWEDFYWALTRNISKIAVDYGVT